MDHDRPWSGIESQEIIALIYSPNLNYSNNQAGPPVLWTEYQNGANLNPNIVAEFGECVGLCGVIGDRSVQIRF